MLIWSQLTCVIRPGLAPMPGWTESEEPCLCFLPSLCPLSTLIPMGHEWEVFPTLCSCIWSNLFLKELPKVEPRFQTGPSQLSIQKFSSPGPAEEEAKVTYPPKRAMRRFWRKMGLRMRPWRPPGSSWVCQIRRLLSSPVLSS